MSESTKNKLHEYCQRHVGYTSMDKWQIAEFLCTQIDELRTEITELKSSSSAPYVPFVSTKRGDDSLERT
jgi:hypothetical protein